MLAGLSKPSPVAIVFGGSIIRSFELCKVTPDVFDVLVEELLVFIRMWHLFGMFVDALHVYMTCWHNFIISYISQARSHWTCMFITHAIF